MKQKLENVKAMCDFVISCIKYNQNSIGRNISMSYSMKKNYETCNQKARYCIGNSEY